MEKKKKTGEKTVLFASDSEDDDDDGDDVVEKLNQKCDEPADSKMKWDFVFLIIIDNNWYTRNFFFFLQFCNFQKY